MRYELEDIRMSNLTKASQTGKSKTLLIVVDGLDYEYIKNHIHEFSLFRTWLEGKRLNPLESVVPADSIPAWITIYTGLNPAEHGIIESINYMDFKRKSQGDYSVIQGHAMWDVLSQGGKKVLVFNPFLAYPAWDLNGLMISGPVFESGNASTNQADQVDTASLPPLGGLVDHPDKNKMSQFVEMNLDLTQKQFNTFNHYLSRDAYDFAFLGILTADRIQHFLWRYADAAKRPSGKNSLSGAIIKTYQLVEKNIAQILNQYGDEYNIVIISDHGHGPRCHKTFYINQWLISEGFMKGINQKKRVVEYAKHATLAVLEKMHCVEAGVKFLKRFEVAHKVKNTDYIFNAKEKVFAPHFDGTNPFGGIHVDRDAFQSDEAYEDMRLRMISGLMKVRDAGKPVMLWAKRREEIYFGSKTDHYPEIVYCLVPEYGVDRGLFGKRLFGSNSFRDIVSGGHRLFGVIMGNTDGTEDVRSVLNVHQFVLNLCGFAQD
jgi:predicted AlkP superfamily phosphohydrolase/phosphomutase